MRTAVLAAALLTLLAPGCGGPCQTEPAGPEAFVGGDPIPSRATTITFPWMGKQSLMCVGDAFERQVAYVDFTSGEGNVNVGTATLDEKGAGTARFAAPVNLLRTGHEDRDRKLLGDQWLGAEKHPELVFEATKMERVLPTVWSVEGTWTMKGVSKPVSFFANVRYLPEMDRVGKDIVRLHARFDIELAEHGVGGAYVGTPAVAATWQVELVLLGIMDA